MKSKIWSILRVTSVAFFVAGSAFAQNAGTVTNHAFVLGKGPGTTGYTSLLCGSAQLAVGQAAADPICKTITGDVTISAAGVTAIGATKVTSAMLNADVFSTAHTWSGAQSFTSASGIYLGTSSNIEVLPGNPATGPGGNAFDGGIITHTVTGNYQVSAYQVSPTTGTVPDWGPISEFVTRRVDGTNFQRISFTSMAAFAGPALNDAATDYRIQAESGGSATLLPIKFTQQQNTLGSYYEYLTLAPSNDGNIRMFRRTDSPGLTANNLSLTLGQQKRATANVLTAAGTQNSPQFIIEGNGYDTSLHTAAVRQYVEMTSNAGAATWHLQYQLDGAGFGDLITATSAGNVSLGTLNTTTVNAVNVNVAGATSGGVIIKSPAVAGSNTLTLPAGTTNFSATGGASQVVKQTSVGGAFTVSQVANTDLSGLGTGVATALGVNVGSAGAFVTNNADNTFSGQGLFTSSKVLAATGNASGGGFQPSAFNMWGGTNPTVAGSGVDNVSYPTQGVTIAINHANGSGQINGLTVGASQLGGVTIGAPTGSDKGLGTINAQGAYYSNGVVGVTCSGTPTASFATTLGIVTHC